MLQANGRLSLLPSPKWFIFTATISCLFIFAFSRHILTYIHQRNWAFLFHYIFFLSQYQQFALAEQIKLWRPYVVKLTFPPLEHFCAFFFFFLQFCGIITFYIWANLFANYTLPYLSNTLYSFFCHLQMVPAKNLYKNLYYQWMLLNYIFCNRASWLFLEFLTKYVIVIVRLAFSKIFLLA